MQDNRDLYAHRDDHPHLKGDDLAAKVARAIRYTALIDTSDIVVSAIGRMVVIDGHVGGEQDIACAGEAAACVIGVGSVLNRLTVRNRPS
ncbi:BON domain-containing protein [Ensifer soli]|uniref:BON domain-containing protein n=1 Tax=Ciceribacter sp. sgz301302 TaxID=3342379 RepID=UPI0035B815B9